MISKWKKWKKDQVESSLALSCDHGEVDSGSRRSEVIAESHENKGERVHGLSYGQVDDSMLRCRDKTSMPECCVHDSSGSNKSFQLEQKLTLDKKFLLNGFLEDVFVAKASNVSKNVEWIEFVCSEFSSSCAYLQDSLVPSMHLWYNESSNNYPILFFHMI